MARDHKSDINRFLYLKDLIIEDLNAEHSLIN